MPSSCSVLPGRVSRKQTTAVLMKSRIREKGSGFNRSTENRGLTQSATIPGALEELVSDLHIRELGGTSSGKEERRGGKQSTDKGAELSNMVGWESRKEGARIKSQEVNRDQKAPECRCTSSWRPREPLRELHLPNGTKRPLQSSHALMSWNYRTFSRSYVAYFWEHLV